MKLLLEGARQLGLSLTGEHLRMFQVYYGELVAWNARFNLTAITDYEQVQVRHFLDSLSCVRALVGTDYLLPVTLAGPALRLARPLTCIDVGSGAGFPGLPLKIVFPRLHLTLLEATGKKVTFLEHMVERLGLEEVMVIKGRAEELGQMPGHRERYDLVLARAVAELPALAEYLLPLCRLGGLCIAQKGIEAQAEVASAQAALAILGGELRRIIPVELPGLAETRHLVVLEKTARTPEKYPRRPGMPTKRPL
ncbi:MAG: 16S rRNA (guanine(527)-N(7))-methyltransferase RsmG [Anaerolineae bacterium]|jgi:16S rRNA (guanine527-N7)-methyltransferase|nr:16S rRNA (guanine(527)-N(7))-methyltransferase RsmG [Anaerolineae bacterium]MDH7473407.1 16S rRNA (guanine(527)-N(7))-methyltransferase RsmG [Anaerolineae bacterium]